jgi:hypothetical protein
MPTFDFENPITGERLERVYPVGRAPRSIRVTGEKFVRVPSAPVLKIPRDVTHVSDQLPLHWKHAPSHDEQGRCRFRSQREIDETVARARHAGEPVLFNDGLDDYGKTRERRSYAEGVDNPQRAQAHRASRPRKAAARASRKRS